MHCNDKSDFTETCIEAYRLIYKIIFPTHRKTLLRDFDATFGAGGTHFVGGFALIVTSGAARGAANNQSIKSVGIFSDLESRGLGDVIATFEPGHLGRRLAIDLTFEYDLKESNKVR